MKVKELRAWLASRDPEDEVEVELTVSADDSRWHWVDWFPISELAPDGEGNVLAVDLRASSTTVADLHETLADDCDCHPKEPYVGKHRADPAELVDAA